jgi:hypothetical protein
MRKLVSLAALAALVLWLRGRRGHDPERAVTIGYVDGSSVTLDAGSPELDRLVEIAVGATPR